MMRPTTQIVTASGSNPIPLDYYVNGYAVAVTMKTTGAKYTLQYSLDDPNFDALNTFTNGTPTRYSVSMNASATWFNWDDPLLVNASSNRSTNLAFSPSAIRVLASANVSAGNPLIVTVRSNGADGG